MAMAGAPSMPGLAPKPTSIHTTRGGEMPTKFMFLGNPGVGKSTLANSLILSYTGERVAPFKTGVQIGQGLTMDLNVWKFRQHMAMDTPGLADVKLRKKAAEAIAAAFREGGNFKVFFVMTEEAGRVREADLATLKVVLEAVPQITPNNFGIIINKVNPKTCEKIYAKFDEFVAYIFGPIEEVLPGMFTEHVYIIERDPELDCEDNVAKPLPRDVVRFIRTVPAVKVDSDKVKDLKYDEVEKVREQMAAQQEKVKADTAAAIDSMQKKHAVEMEALQNNLKKAQKQGSWDKLANAIIRVAEVMPMILLAHQNAKAGARIAGASTASGEPRYMPSTGPVRASVRPSIEPVRNTGGESTNTGGESTVSQSTKTTTGGVSYNGASAEVSHTTTEPTFKFGCQWGCGRQNVVSKPGNSCGLEACNKAWQEQHGGVLKGLGRIVKVPLGAGGTPNYGGK